MLTPGPGGAWVTSERATITAVHPYTGALAARTADGRVLHLDAEATSAERLTHSYALMVHRSQGTTADTAHVLEGGGGRELAYVAMSRARHTTHVYLPASNIDGAADHLGWAWTNQQRPVWAHDQALPALPQPVSLTTEATRPTVLQLPTAELHRLRDEQEMIESGITRDLERRRLNLAAHIATVHENLARLHAGAYPWKDNASGIAARALTAADLAHRAARQQAERPGASILDRHRASRAARALAHARQDWQRDGQPEADRLHAQRAEFAAELAILYNPATARAAWRDQHHHLTRRLDQLDQLLAGQPTPTHDPRPRPAITRPQQDQAIDLGL
jgi:hypothetical protein